MKYLAGEQVEPRAPVLRKHIGVAVKYLRQQDIDNSGRGYFFPRVGVIEEVRGREFWDGGDWVHMRDIREMVLLGGGAA